MTRIEEIEAREKAATAGPWLSATRASPKPHIVSVDALRADNMGESVCQLLPRREATGDFIAHAREDIPYLLAELREAREKLKALEEMAEKLPPLDWKPRDDWGDYTAYPCADGSLSGVDETNSGDVHCHGIAVGEQTVHKELDRILQGGD